MLLGDGVDGLWSTFAIRVGTPAQNVRVLASTNALASLVVVHLGCTLLAVNLLPDNSANARGGLFSSNSSTTWRDQGQFGINENGVGFEANLEYSQPADYGEETLDFGYEGGANSLKPMNQTIGGIATTSPFYI